MRPQLSEFNTVRSKRSANSKRGVFGIFAILGVSALLINLTMPQQVLADHDKDGKDSETENDNVKKADPTKKR